jgi:hypothetical protein
MESSAECITRAQKCPTSGKYLPPEEEQDMDLVVEEKRIDSSSHNKKYVISSNSNKRTFFSLREAAQEKFALYRFVWPQRVARLQSRDRIATRAYESVSNLWRLLLQAAQGRRNVTVEEDQVEKLRIILQWPAETDMHCFHCGQPISGAPIPIPLCPVYIMLRRSKPSTTPKTLTVWLIQGVAGSFPCALAYLRTYRPQGSLPKHCTRNEQEHQLQRWYRAATLSGIPLAPAPDWRMLAQYNMYDHTISAAAFHEGSDEHIFFNESSLQVIPSASMSEIVKLNTSDDMLSTRISGVRARKQFQKDILEAVRKSHNTYENVEDDVNALTACSPVVKRICSMTREIKSQSLEDIDSKRSWNNRNSDINLSNRKQKQLASEYLGNESSPRLDTSIIMENRSPLSIIKVDVTPSSSSTPKPEKRKRRVTQTQRKDFSAPDSNFGKEFCFSDGITDEYGRFLPASKKPVRKYVKAREKKRNSKNLFVKLAGVDQDNAAMNKIDQGKE